MDDRLDEILYRLRDLDQRLASLEHGGRPQRHDPHEPHGHHLHDHHPHHHSGHHGSDRRRDERGPVGDHGRGGPDRGRGRSGERGEDFDEKRVIDTIVRLVCENLSPIIEQIVARELDRRAPASAEDTGAPRS